MGYHSFQDLGSTALDRLLLSEQHICTCPPLFKAHPSFTVQPKPTPHTSCTSGCSTLSSPLNECGFDCTIILLPLLFCGSLATFSQILGEMIVGYGLHPQLDQKLSRELDSFILSKIIHCKRSRRNNHDYVHTLCISLQGRS